MSDTAAILQLTSIKPLEHRVQVGAKTNDTLNSFGFIEYHPNGTSILRNTTVNDTNAQSLLLFNSVLDALKLMPSVLNGNNAINRNPLQEKYNTKLYGDGVEQKFPPFMENVIQRIQTYFSVYKYEDTSKPNKIPTPELTEEHISTVKAEDKRDRTTQLHLPGFLLKKESKLPKDAEKLRIIVNYDNSTITSVGNKNEDPTIPEIREDIDISTVRENVRFL